MLIKANNHTPEEERDMRQPWRKTASGRVEANEKFIKEYNSHPDKEIEDYYIKKGLIDPRKNK